MTPDHSQANAVIFLKTAMLLPFFKTGSKISLLIALNLLLLLSGCVMDRGYYYRQQQYELYLEIAKLKQQIADLEVEKHEIEQQQKLDEQLTSQLQLGLLKKHARINELLIKNKQLVSEFVRYNVELKNKDSKVETVRLLAEAATIVETAKSKYPSEKAAKIIKNAELYLNESTEELKADNFEGASYLAYQALDIVQTLRSNEKSASEEEGSEEEVSFVLHLPMKVLRESNVREEPDSKAKVIYVEKGGDIVNAIGFRGYWVKIESGEFGTGWIYYSLLSGLMN